jgi:hypothetical protein
VSESILKPHAATILDLKLSGKTNKAIHKWVKAEGVCIGYSALSDFIVQLLDKRDREQLLDRIASGASQVRETEERFKKNPAPELEALMKIFRVFILQLSTSGQTDPELLKLADQLMNTVAQIFSAQTKAHFKEREVTLAEQKAIEAKKTEQQKALEFCLEEAKAFPEVLELFKAAFAGLKTAKGVSRSGQS